MNVKGRHCLVHWHEYSDSVALAVQSLRYDEELLDVTLACDGQTIRAHKLVLAASSLYFRQVLKDFPCDHPTIVLDGVDWSVLLALLHFMYYGQVLVEEESVGSLLHAATSLHVIGLTYVTAAVVQANLRDEEVGLKKDSSKERVVIVGNKDKDEVKENKIKQDEKGRTDVSINGIEKKTIYLQDKNREEKTKEEKKKTKPNNLEYFYSTDKVTKGESSSLSIEKPDDLACTNSYPLSLSDESKHSLINNSRPRAILSTKEVNSNGPSLKRSEEKVNSIGPSLKRSEENGDPSDLELPPNKKFKNIHESNSREVNAIQDMNLKEEDLLQNFNTNKTNDMQNKLSDTFCPKPSDTFGPKSSDTFGLKPSDTFGLKTSDCFGPKPSGTFGLKTSDSLGPKPSDTFCPKPSDNFGLKSSDTFGLKPSDTFGHKPSDTFGHKPSDTFGHKSSDTFGLKPSDTFGLKTSDSLGPKPSDTFCPKPSDTFGLKSSDTFGLKPSDTFGHKPSDTFGHKPSDTFGHKPNYPIGPIPSDPFEETDQLEGSLKSNYHGVNGHHSNGTPICHAEEMDSPDHEDSLDLDGGDASDIFTPSNPLSQPAVASAAAALAAAAVAGKANTANLASYLAANSRGLSGHAGTANGSGHWIPPLSSDPAPDSPLEQGGLPPGFIQSPGMTQQEIQASLEQYQRKLAFHEPRPCPTCRRMYRDAATLRTHIAIMHSQGPEAFSCSCGSLFPTKYDMYQHKKKGHR